jgi:hypothetical protein
MFSFVAFRFCHAHSTPFGVVVIARLLIPGLSSGVNQISPLRGWLLEHNGHNEGTKVTTASRKVSKGRCSVQPGDKLCGTLWFKKGTRVNQISPLRGWLLEHNGHNERHKGHSGDPQSIGKGRCSVQLCGLKGAGVNQICPFGAS